ncbi:hypothetical protein [Hymenobacter guriensis]|uniref:Uncharacterized protein n=1 Tax=Hymenobacter guriensis TaxID=2793065 RepID=A0ABS0L4K4_9BACT|nr:hypothetical protein [Hymenobacter guriensis]MBG8555006.1 hypothetical protein [Hymenobacter guriensis]
MKQTFQVVFTVEVTVDDITEQIARDHWSTQEGKLLQNSETRAVVTMQQQLLAALKNNPTLLLEYFKVESLLAVTEAAYEDMCDFTGTDPETQVLLNQAAASIPADSQQLFQRVRDEDWTEVGYSLLEESFGSEVVAVSIKPV